MILYVSLAPKFLHAAFLRYGTKKNSIFNFIKKSRKLWARYLVFFNVRLKIYSKSDYHYYLVIGDRFIASSIFIDWYTVWPHLPIMIINSIMSLKILHYLSMHFRCILFKQRNCLCCWPSLYIIQYDFFLGKKIITKLKHLSILKSNSSHGVIFQAQKLDHCSGHHLIFCVLYLTWLLKFLAFI